MIAPPLSILSIQSWVSYGHVGNAAAMFPLQRLGFEVWGIQTVQFSNHTGYGTWTGQVYPPQSVSELVEGMAARGALAGCAAVLSGYLGSEGTAEAVVGAVRQVRAAHPAALYCCDPVMGDVGRGIFVRAELPERIEELAVPQADILTPNQFELELLTGEETGTLNGVLHAARRLRDRMRQGGPRVVVVTSVRREDAPADSIETLAVSDAGAWLCRTGLLPLDPPRNGTGDTIAALFLGHYLRSGRADTALSLAMSGLYGVLELTHRLGTRELQLIAAQEQYAHPSQVFAAEQVAGPGAADLHI